MYDVFYFDEKGVRRPGFDSGVTRLYVEALAADMPDGECAVAHSSSGSWVLLVTRTGGVTEYANIKAVPAIPPI